MFDKQGFHLFGLLDFIIKRKELIIIIFMSSLVLIYIGIFFLVEEQFEATATIIPREEDASSIAGGLLSSMKKMPLGLGSKSVNAEMDLYKTIIYSRTMMENVIKKFGLLQVYKLDTSNIAHMENAVKRLRNEIGTTETEESALLVTVRAGTRQRAADITNYIVQTMNERIIELKVSRSRENRIFLEKRVEEISKQLRLAEDSLRAFQERTGLLDVKTQLEGILSTHATIENELIAKRIQLGILERMYDKESQQVKELDAQIQEFQKKLRQLRAQGDPGSPLLSLKKLPKTGSEFVRIYREVEINNLLMQYIVPLYEQAKIEEKKDYPVLQVIDYAVPPAKRSYPPRTILAAVGAFSVTLLVLIFIRFREVAMNITDSRWYSMLKDIKRWNWKINRLK
jgi:capsule polysaccharide export protein KpsE/RkpR